MEGYYRNLMGQINRFSSNSGMQTAPDQLASHRADLE